MSQPDKKVPTLEMARKVLNLIDFGLCSGIGNGTPGNMCIEAAVCNALGMPNGDDPTMGVLCKEGYETYRGLLEQYGVSPALRRFKISLNDKSWSSKDARAKGMRRLGIAQLGSHVMDDKKFAKLLAVETIKVFVPIAMRAAAKLNPKFAAELEQAAVNCELVPTRESALAAKEVANKVKHADDDDAAADAAADAADAAAAAADAAAYAADAAAIAKAAADAAAYAAYAYAAERNKRRDEVLTQAAEVCISVLRQMNVPGIALMDELCPLDK